jgi:hypothetical protein
VAGSRLGSARRASRASAAFAVALLSRDSSLVPSKAVLRREPRRRRVRCCARAADIARLLVVPPFPALCDIPEWWSSSPSWSMPGCCPSRGSCAARLTRRKESLERREPESIRLWPLLALPDRVRGDSSWTAKSAVLSLSIGASGTRRWNVSSVNLLALIKFGFRFRFFPLGLLLRKEICYLHRTVKEWCSSLQYQAPTMQVNCELYISDASNHSNSLGYISNA